MQKGQLVLLGKSDPRVSQFQSRFLHPKKDSTNVRKHSIQHAEKTIQTHRFSICLMNMDEVWKNDKKLNTRLILKGENTQIAMFTSIAQRTRSSILDIKELCRHDSTSTRSICFFLCFASDKKIIKTCSRNTYHIYIYTIYIYILKRLDHSLPKAVKTPKVPSSALRFHLFHHTS